MPYRKRQVSYTPLYGIIATFVIPMILAHTLFYSGYGRKHPSSKGTLITPPIIVKQQPLKYWQIASLSPSNDDMAALETLEKRWVALGKDKKRVHLTVFINKKYETNTNKSWQVEQLPQAIMKKLEGIKSKHRKTCKLFIIDPESRAILCYDQLNALRDIDLDLRKLLKSSRV